MDNKRAPVNTKNFVVNGSKEDRSKERWKVRVEKDILAKGLKKSDVHDCAA